MDIQGKHILVVGLGESGLAMARWLHREGAKIRLADSRATPPNLATVQVAIPDAEIVCGAFTPATFAGVELIAISPGVPKATPEIAAAATTIPLISEIDLFVWGLQR